MKRVKIMLSAILVMALVAGALAFKVKKAAGFCVYQTTFTTTEIGDDPVNTCKTLGQYKLTPFPAGVELDDVTTIAVTSCANAPIFTNITDCTRDDLRVTLE